MSIPSPVDTPIKAATPKSNKIFMIIGAAVVALLCLVVSILIVVLIFVLKDKDDDKDKDKVTTTVTPTPIPTTPVADTYQFIGDAIRATLPTGWTIVEYFDGEGSNMLVTGPEMEGTYTGLTGLEIVDPNQTVVLKFEGVDGIGGVDWCQVVYKFSDTSDSFLDEQVTDASSTWGANTVTDLSGQTYTESNFLSKEFRRIGEKIYWDTNNSSVYFDPACGIGANLQVFGKMYFKVKDYDADYKGPYQLIITPGIPESELKELDDILGSAVGLM